MYSHTGRPSIPPEQLLKALLLQALYTIRATGFWWSRSATAFCFAGLWAWLWMRRSGPLILLHQPCELIDSDVSRLLLAKVVEQARAKKLLSDEHFSVDGTLIEAWASVKSFQLKDGPKPPVAATRSATSTGEAQKRYSRLHHRP